MNREEKTAGRELSGSDADPRRHRLAGSPPDKDHADMEIKGLTERRKYVLFLCLAIFLALFAFAFNTPREILEGSVVILTSPANLLTDYFQLANIGATLLNAGLMTLLSLGIIKLSGAAMSGSVIAAVFTVCGFSFFGKNLYSSLPIMSGVFLYSKAARQPFARYMPQCLFGTALSPLVSELSFNIGLPLLPSLALGISSGFLSGFVLPPLSLHFLKFHQGFSLYNTGFTAGIIGMVFMAVLRGFGVNIDTVSILSSGNNRVFSLFLFGLFALMMLYGLSTNHWQLKGFRRLLVQPGTLPTDFLENNNPGVILMNMALLGALSTAYVLALGGELNGPVIGGILTVAGFGAYGKHIRNVVPVLAGIFIMNQLNIHEANASFALTAALFGTTLAPIAGRYGIFAGMLAGMLHMSLVTNTSFLHAGMNLYNNGFSGGFIAALLCPLLEAISQARAARKSRS